MKWTGAFLLLTLALVACTPQETPQEVVQNEPAPIRYSTSTVVGVEEEVEVVQSSPLKLISTFFVDEEEFIYQNDRVPFTLYIPLGWKVSEFADEDHAHFELNLTSDDLLSYNETWIAEHPDIEGDFMLGQTMSISYSSEQTSRPSNGVLSKEFVTFAGREAELYEIETLFRYETMIVLLSEGQLNLDFFSPPWNDVELQALIQSFEILE